MTEPTADDPEPAPDAEAPDPNPRPETGPDPDADTPGEPQPTRGSGQKHDVQRRPEDQRARPDPKETSG